jgi:HrpA-like RNA helicase
MVDPDLKQDEVIICDEVHERHLTGDFMLGLLRAVLARNDKLKAVLMSATINSQLFRYTTDTLTLILVNY